MSKPGVCCVTGHRVGVDVVGAACLAPWATGRACVIKYPAASGTWSVERERG